MTIEIGKMELESLYKRLLTAKEVAKELNITLPIATKLLKQAGIIKNVKGRPKKYIIKD